MATLNKIPVNKRTIDFFKGQFKGGGARPNLFECLINVPEGPKAGQTGVDDKLRFMIKATSLPASNVNTIPIPFRGREFKIAGDRSFEPWTVTVLNDTDFTIRRTFERWMNILNKHEDNAGIINPADYMRSMRVLQLGRASLNNTTDASPVTATHHPVHASYQFMDAWPSEVSSIDLSYDTTDTMEEFTVTFQYQWYDIEDSSGNSIVGSFRDDGNPA